MATHEILPIACELRNLLFSDSDKKLLLVFSRIITYIFTFYLKKV